MPSNSFKENPPLLPWKHNGAPLNLQAPRNLPVQRGQSDCHSLAVWGDSPYSKSLWIRGGGPVNDLF